MDFKMWLWSVCWGLLMFFSMSVTGVNGENVEYGVNGDIHLPVSIIMYLITHRDQVIKRIVALVQPSKRYCPLWTASCYNFDSASSARLNLFDF